MVFLICISTMANYVEHFFMCILSSVIIGVGKYVNNDGFFLNCMFILKSWNNVMRILFFFSSNFCLNFRIIFSISKSDTKQKQIIQIEIALNPLINLMRIDILTIFSLQTHVQYVFTLFMSFSIICYSLQCTDTAHILLHLSLSTWGVMMLF